MKITKTASGQNVLSMNREEWIRHGVEKGWAMQAAAEGQAGNVFWQCRICGLASPQADFMEEGHPECPQCGSTYVNKFSV